MAIDREMRVRWFHDGRARTREVFAIPKPETYYERPILLRNPIVFYEGHLPAFTINTLIKLALKQPGVDAGYEVLFERGIDPESAAAAKPPADQWPSRRCVKEYGVKAAALIERALAAATIENDDVPQLRGVEASLAVTEHD